MTRENIADDSKLAKNLLTGKYDIHISKIGYEKDRWLGGRALICIDRWKWCTLLLVLATSVFGLIYQGVSVGLLVALFQLVFIFSCAKLSFFSFFPAIINFCLLQEYAAVKGWKVYGLLALGYVPLYFNELKICTYMINIVIIFFILFTNCLRNEETLLKIKYHINAEASLAFVVLAVVITILIFPNFPNLSNLSNAGEGNRFDSGIIPFAGWSIVPFFLLAASLGNAKYLKVKVASIIFVIAWYALRGERVEALGFALFIAVRYCFNSKNKRAIIKVIILMIFIIPIFISIGSLRIGSLDTSPRNLLQLIIIQATACDVTYVFNCAVDLFYSGIHLHGITYLSYLVNCVPLLDDPYSFSKVIQQYYYTAGGGLFFAEPIANYGFVFTLLLIISYIVLVTYILSHKGTYTYLVYSVFMISIFRSAWYGMNYPIVTLIYFIPFAILVNAIFDK